MYVRANSVLRILSLNLLQHTHGTEFGPCCSASTLCSACNATLAQETLYRLAKLVSLYRPNGRIRAIPLHRQRVTDRLSEKTVGPSLPAGILGQSGSDCHTARLGEPHLFLQALVR